MKACGRSAQCTVYFASFGLLEFFLKTMSSKLETV